MKYTIHGSYMGGTTLLNNPLVLEVICWVVSDVPDQNRMREGDAVSFHEFHGRLLSNLQNQCETHLMLST